MKTYDKRDEHIGFIKGIIYFPDFSELHIREFVNVEYEKNRITYAYHYMKNLKMIFRYDNASDVEAVSLVSFPHHKHLNSKRVIESDAPLIEEILDEIIDLIM